MANAFIIMFIATSICALCREHNFEAKWHTFDRFLSQLTPPVAWRPSLGSGPRYQILRKLRESKNSRPCENRTRHANDSRIAVRVFTRATFKKV